MNNKEMGGAYATYSGQ